jgi:hypothetical protein
MSNNNVECETHFHCEECRIIMSNARLTLIAKNVGVQLVAPRVTTTVFYRDHMNVSTRIVAVLEGVQRSIRENVWSWGRPYVTQEKGLSVCDHSMCAVGSGDSIAYIG